MMRLGNPDGADRLAAVGHRALRLGACSYKRIASIRKHALAPQPVPGPRTAAPGLTPGHSRGAPSAPPTQEPFPLQPPAPRHTAGAVAPEGQPGSDCLSAPAWPRYNSPAAPAPGTPDGPGRGPGSQAEGLAGHDRLTPSG